MRPALVRMIDRVCRMASAVVLASLLVLGSAAAQSALEDSDAAQQGTNEGLYLELGAGPSISSRRDPPVSLSIPRIVGLSFRDDYEGPAGDTTVGYFDGGLIASLSPSIIPPQYGLSSVTGRRIASADMSEVTGAAARSPIVHFIWPTQALA